MALKFRKVMSNTFTDEKIRRLKDPNKLIIAIYLMTAQVNRIGLYYLSHGKAAEECMLPMETFARLLPEVCKTLEWVYDEDASVIYLPRWWKYNPPANIKHLIGCLDDIDEVPQSKLKADFIANTEHLEEWMVKIFNSHFNPEPTRKGKGKGKSEKAQIQAKTEPDTVCHTVSDTLSDTVCHTVSDTVCHTVSDTVCHMVPHTVSISEAEARAESEAVTEAEAGAFKDNATSPPAPPSDTPRTADALPSGSASPTTPASQDDPVLLTFELRGGGTWDLRESKVRQYELTFPGVNVRQQCREAWQWVHDRPKDRKTYKGMPDYLRNWLAKHKPKQGAYTPSVVKNVDVIVSSPSVEEAFDPKTAMLPFSGPEFRRSLVRWVEYLSEVGKRPNRHLIEATLEQAIDWGEQNFIGAVHDACMNGWKTLRLRDGAIPDRMPKPKPVESNDIYLMSWELKKLQEHRRTAPRPPVSGVQA